MKALPEKGNRKIREKKERKRIIVALRVVLALKLNCSNNNSPPRTFSSSSFFRCFSVFVHLLNLYYPLIH